MYLIILHFNNLYLQVCFIPSILRYCKSKSKFKIEMLIPFGNTLHFLYWFYERMQFSVYYVFIPTGINLSKKQ